MSKNTFLAAWACLLLISQFQALVALSPPLSPESRAHLDKRSTWRSWWWSWSSPAPSQSSNSYTSPSAKPSPSPDSYTNVNVQPSHHPSAPPAGSYGPPQPKHAPIYKGPKIPVHDSDIKRWLDSHNKFRAQYSAGPLKWSEELVAASKRLTDTCVWRHTQNNPFGENMSAGQKSIEEVVSGWVTGPDEKNSYTGGNTEPSHFTQVVWEATTEVGCYQGMCQDVRGANLPQSPVTFWACNYNPPGNVIGEIAKNVKAAPGGRPL